MRQSVRQARHAGGVAGRPEHVAVRPHQRGRGRLAVQPGRDGGAAVVHADRVRPVQARAGGAIELAEQAAARDEGEVPPGDCIEKAAVREGWLRERLAGAGAGAGMQARAQPRGRKLENLRRAGLEAAVALRSDYRVGGLDDVPELDGQCDELPHMRRTLGLVCVEQRVGRPAGEHQLKLPGEVGDVADPCAQPLTQERRGLVRRVAGEQHPPAAPAARDDGMEGVDHCALDIGVVRPDPP